MVMVHVPVGEKNTKVDGAAGGQKAEFRCHGEV